MKIKSDIDKASVPLSVNAYSKYYSGFSKELNSIVLKIKNNTLVTKSETKVLIDKIKKTQLTTISSDNLNTDISKLKAQAALVSNLIYLLSYKNKDSSKFINEQISTLLSDSKLKFFNKNIKLAESQIRIITKELPNNPVTSLNLLDSIGKYQPMPLFARQEITKIIGEKHKSLGYNNISSSINLIDNSLKKTNSLLSNDSAKYLRVMSNAICEDLYSNRLTSHNIRNKSYLDTIDLLAKNGNIVGDSNILSTIEKLKSNNNIDLSSRAKKFRSDYEIGYGIKTKRFLRVSDLKKTVVIAAKSLSLFSRDYSHKEKKKIYDLHFKTVKESFRKNIINSYESVKDNLGDEKLFKKVSNHLAFSIKRSSNDAIGYNLASLCLNSYKTLLPSIVSSTLDKLPYEFKQNILDDNANARANINLINLIKSSLKKVDQKNIGLFPIDAVNQIKKIIDDDKQLKKISLPIKNALTGLQNEIEIIFQKYLPTKIIQTIPLSLSKSKNDESKDIKTLKKELLALNLNNISIKKFVSNVDKRLEVINKIYESKSSFFPSKDSDIKIKSYSSDQLKKLAFNLKSLKEKELDKKLKDSNLTHESYENEVIACAMHASKIVNGYLPRDTQLISLLLLLEKSQNKDNCGKLLQIKTGEGKSLITAMLSASTAILENKSVDIITSAAPLAKRDAKEQRSFFNILGLTASHNCYKQNTGLKKCYEADIVYGNSINFQADLLRSEFKGYGVRGMREFGAIVIDEVDSMLIDESGKIAKLAMPITGMEHIQSLVIFIWSYIEKMKIDSDELSNPKYFAKVKESLDKIISQIVRPNSQMMIVPQFLKPFVYRQSKYWADSALRAMKMKENVNYVIAEDDSKDKIIAPVDYGSTGVVQTNTSWSRGLHQFLQIKHRLRLTSETLTTSFISNMSYFKRYSKITGLTGTMGSESERNLLEEVYKIDTANIPTFKKKQFKELDGIIATDAAEHIKQVTKRAILEAKSKKAVLIIAETIDSALTIIKSLKTNYSSNNQGKIQNYLRSDDDSSSFNGKCDSGDIIVATNLAGRGTDIATSNDVEKAGGLHVIISYLPNNLRVEEQALGRTSRRGQKGSGEIIINGSVEASKYNIQYDPTNTDPLNQAKIKSIKLSHFKKVRDLYEQEKLKQTRNTKVKSLGFEDNLFTRFNGEIYQPLKLKDSNKQKLMQLEDLWGFWLGRVVHNKNDIHTKEGQNRINNEFARFKNKAFSRYLNQNYKLMENPAYMSNLVMNKLGNDSYYDEPIRLLNNPNSFDKYYSYQLHYLKAYAHLRHNGAMGDSDKAKADKARNTNEAFKHLQTALSQIEQIVLPQLQSSILHLNPIDNKSPLFKQINNKIRLLETTAKNLKENINLIKNESGEDKWLGIKKTPQTYHSLFSKEVSEKDINELSNFGLSYIFDAKAKSYDKDYLTGAIVAIAGIAQVIAGAVIAIGSGGFASSFGISLATGGVMDFMQGVSSALKGESINLGDWVKGKAIEIAVSMALAGVSSAVSKGATKAGEEALKQGVKEGGKQTVVKVATSRFTQEAMRKFGGELVKRIITSKVIEFAAGGLMQAASKPIGAEVKRLKAKIKTTLNSNPVKDELQLICRSDRIEASDERYIRSFQEDVLSRLNQKNDQFASIAQQLLTGGAQSVVARNGGNLGLSIGVSLVSSGVSIGRGISEINDLKSYIISGIKSSSKRGVKSLPSFSKMLLDKSRSIGSNDAKEIEKILINNKTLKPGLFVDTSKLGFQPGIKQITSNNTSLQGDGRSLRPSPLLEEGRVRVNNTQKSIKQFEYQDLSKKNNIPRNTSLREVHSTTTQSLESKSNITKTNPLQLGKYNSNRGYRLETAELLSEIDKANKANYTERINQVGDGICQVVEERLRGMVHSGIITPISSFAVNQASRELSEWIEKRGKEANLALAKAQKKDELEAIKLENNKNNNSLEIDPNVKVRKPISGLSAGDSDNIIGGGSGDDVLHGSENRDKLESKDFVDNSKKLDDFSKVNPNGNIQAFIDKQTQVNLGEIDERLKGHVDLGDRLSEFDKKNPVPIFKLKSSFPYVDFDGTVDNLNTNFARGSELLGTIYDGTVRYGTDRYLGDQKAELFATGSVYGSKVVLPKLKDIDNKLGNYPSYGLKYTGTKGLEFYNNYLDNRYGQLGFNVLSSYGGVQSVKFGSGLVGGGVKGAIGKTNQGIKAFRNRGKKSLLVNEQLTPLGSKFESIKNLDPKNIFQRKLLENEYRSLEYPNVNLQKHPDLKSIAPYLKEVNDNHFEFKSFFTNVKPTDTIKDVVVNTKKVPSFITKNSSVDGFIINEGKDLPGSYSKISPATTKHSYKNFDKKIEWKSTSGTKQKYLVYKRKDIDWDMKRTRTDGPEKFVGKTNREAALRGYPPELNDGSIVHLHHISQNSKGPLVEIASRLHSKENKQAFKALHNQFGGKGHPANPVRPLRSKFGTDKSNYWKWRAGNESKK